MIIENNIVNNRWVGIGLYDSSNNAIHHNNFINSTSQAYIRNYKDTSHNNTWDNDYPSGGNYWGDYADVGLYSGPYQNETGSDRIGDTPYFIDKNNHPFIEP